MDGWLAGRGGDGSGRRGRAREKDIKVRNSQRGERAPPRHRLDRGSLIPLLECSPLPRPLPPPPSATHSPAIRLPLSPLPPSLTPSSSFTPYTGVLTTTHLTHLHPLRRTGEPPSTCSTYTLARLCQFLSCCRHFHCLRHRCKNGKRKEKALNLGREKETAATVRGG